MIGTLGRKIIFEVSDDKAMTFHDMTRDISSRWAEHEVLGCKPKPEFLGPANQSVSLTITLSSSLGVRPRNVLEAIEGMVEAGTAEYLVIGHRTVGKNPFRLTASSETWDRVFSRGELSKATVTMDREFGLNMDFVDKPPEVAKSLYTAEVTKKVAKYIPTVRVQEITWSAAEGKLSPKVVITSA